MTGAGNNTYLIGAETRSATLIDAGVGEPRHLADLGEALHAHRARLASVLVTHGHRDHIAGTPALARRIPTPRSQSGRGTTMSRGIRSNGSS
jgi:Zn-dependent hydrolases, including glyoxylases